MSQYNDYTRPSVNGGYGSYSSLANYNQRYYGGGITVPVPATTVGFETVLIPRNKSAGYNSLRSCIVKQQNNGSGYLNINDSYPNYSNNCNRFTSRLCGGW